MLKEALPADQDASSVESHENDLSMQKAHMQKHNNWKNDELNMEDAPVSTKEKLILTMQNEKFAKRQLL